MRIRVIGIVGPVLAGLLAGCASVALPQPEAGFHAAAPFRRPGSNAAASVRSDLFRAHALSANAIGFQAGSAPMSVQEAETYIQASGAPDLAVKLAQAEQKVAGWQSATDAAGGGVSLAVGANLGAMASLGMGVAGLFGAIAGAEASAYPAIAGQFNARLSQALQVPLSKASAHGLRELPGPPPDALRPGPNASLDDLVWERSVFEWVGRPSRVPLLYPGPKNGAWLVGGVRASRREVEAHMRAYGSDAEAGAFIHGDRMAFAGQMTAVIAVLATVGGIVGAVSNAGTGQAWTGALIGGGLLCIPVASWLMVDGRATARRAVHDFDGALPGRLSLRVGGAAQDPQRSQGKP